MRNPMCANEIGYEKSREKKRRRKIQCGRMSEDAAMDRFVRAHNPIMLHAVAMMARGLQIQTGN